MPVVADEIKCETLWRLPAFCFVTNIMEHLLDVIFYLNAISESQRSVVGGLKKLQKVEGPLTSPPHPGEHMDYSQSPE